MLQQNVICLDHSAPLNVVPSLAPPGSDNVESRGRELTLPPLPHNCLGLKLWFCRLVA